LSGSVEENEGRLFVKAKSSTNIEIYVGFRESQPHVGEGQIRLQGQQKRALLGPFLLLDCSCVFGTFLLSSTFYLAGQLGLDLSAFFPANQIISALSTKWNKMVHTPAIFGLYRF
jgi:hypothetical protein